MRVNAETKERTRARIRAAAARLFAEKGFTATSTRELAASARIGVGTLFNYAASKEVLALELIDAALALGEKRFRERRRPGVALDEDLFDHVAAGLRELEAYRTSLGEMLQVALGPFARPGGSDLGERIRARHLETVAEILFDHGHAAGGGSFANHLYWTLYLGLLGAWSRDGSPGGSDSWVILDHSMRVYSGTISRESAGLESSDGH